MFSERLLEDMSRDEERYPRSAEILKTLGVRDLGIDDETVGKDIAGKMVIRNDDLYTPPTEESDKINGIDSVIDGDNEADIRKIPKHPLDGSLGHSIPFPEPVRKKWRHVRPDGGKHLYKNRGRAYSIAIVISENDDLPVFANGIQYSLRRLNGAWKLLGKRKAPY